jgi:hypothetical protein
MEALDAAVRPELYRGHGRPWLHTFDAFGALVYSVPTGG